jgi:hypothetical protein
MVLVISAVIGLAGLGGVRFRDKIAKRFSREEVKRFSREERDKERDNETLPREAAVPPLYLYKER